ncbi:membrane fusion protein [Andreprevotia lacus DSM 23236]|jgi:membrane fusion protein|uniref:Membrane fusion protein n=1 Tax=Andreprevotia lacus DSM 23236 TaxID=1121001 RepID=A0A1W1XZ40_9NEIS|nr:HlyD family efflux transporter periplasmic adaptor subunit [Andreprevotia lacus]SMC29183.1 membrane fusion protein [Andreprevotia lacus DSM 23236]
MSNLFRPEALKAQQSSGLGKVVLIQPVSFSIVAVFALCIVLVFGVVLIFGQYTQKIPAIGVLQPREGLSKLQIEQPATLKRLYVKEGERVKAGQVLYLLSTETETADGQQLHAAISQSVKDQLRNMDTQLDNQRTLYSLQLDDAKKKLLQLNMQAGNVDSQIDNQHKKIEIAQRIVERYEQLNRKKYISDLELQQQQGVLLDQQGRLADMERSKSELRIQMHALEADIAQLPAKLAQQRLTIQRDMSSSEATLTRNESEREIKVVAPSDGIIAGILIQQGQRGHAGQIVLSIVPEQATLLAELYVPSENIGYIKKGNRVSLRYDAFPHEKFGLQEGEVTAISSNTFNPNELGIFMKEPAPMYRVLVALKKQVAHAYGKDFPLQVGMSVKANVAVNTKKIYQIMLDPLYAASDKLGAWQ